MSTILKIILFIIFIPVTWADANPIGSYSNGSLEYAACLPSQGEGYIQLYRDLEHIWGTNPLVNMIVKTAAEMNSRYPGLDRLQVEDMSARNGGEVDGHGSHENGLDVDIQYFKADGIEHDPIKTGQMYAPPMVNGTTVSRNFDLQRNWELVKSLHRHGDVQRIFMDQNLKRELCSYAKSRNEYSANIEVLRSIRHVANHQVHMHVRLRCPANARRCVPQAEVPRGSGCP